MTPLSVHSLEGLPGTIAVVVATEATSWLGCVAAGITAVILACSVLKVRGSTLQAPLVWATVAGIGLAVVNAFISTSSAYVSPLSASILRYATAIGTLCPLMAVLGARRPQNRGWQWVVLSLWLILMLPAVQALLLSPGPQLELFPAWRLFLGATIGLGLLNYLPTRFWRSAVLVACGQTLLLDKYLWEQPFVSAQWSETLGVACLLTAVVVVHLQLAGDNTRSRVTSPEVATPGLSTELERHNRQWLRFRDALGAFWALRHLQRVNQTAEICDWPVRLTWTGFVPEDDTPSDWIQPDQLAEIEQTMHTLLRRFMVQDRKS